MTAAAFGTSLAWNGNIVAGLTAINGIEMKRDKIDVTTHQSADGFKEYIAGLAEAGDVSIDGNFEFSDSAGQLAMMADFNSGTSRAAVITFPAITGCTWTLTGFITALTIGDAKLGDAIPFKATIQPTGKPVFAVATSAGMSAVALSNSAVLAPSFAIGTFDYVATVLTGVSSLTVTPTAAAGVITVNGSVVVSGQASSAVALGAAGSITTISIVVTETNKAPKAYTIRVVRAA